VAAAAPVVVNFREPIDPASVHTNTFQVKDDLGRLAQGSFRFSADYATVSFHPGLPWAHQTVYEVTLTGGIRSAGGAALASAKQWHFATGPSGALVENRDVYLQDSLEVPVLRIKTLPQPGGYTLADVNNDIDARDDYEPSVAVLFQADQFGQGLTNANGALRQRGQSTRYARQKSYRVELNRGSGLWRGHRIIILNKHPYDLTRMRNKLSFELFQTVPHLTSLRTLFVNVFMDDADYGLFTQIEHPNADFLAAHGLDPNGHLYKATSFEFYRYATELRSRSDPEYDPWQFEQRLEIRGNANHEKLLAMLDDLNNPDLSINRIIEKYFNRENYLTWFAINILTGNLDTASQNFLLYSPAGDSAWYFMPWDFDGAWDFYHQPNEADSGFLSRWQEGLPNWWGSVLHQRFLRDPNNVAQLVGRVASLAAGYLAESPVRERVLACRIVVQPYISRRPDLWDLPTKDDNNALGEWAGEVDRLPGVVANHHALLQATLERPMPVYIGGPEEVEGGLLFLWDASYDLQGDPLAYDLEISTQPDVQVKLLQRNGLATTYYLLSDALAPGAYFFRVIVRDARNPGVNWQVPFESYWDPIADKVYHGVKRFVIP
jgi:spore coat protein H